jgi:L-threonylcarbamoyladenylate synthase
VVTDESIEQAVGILRSGGLVAFPTETVYGLGADAANPAAVRRVFSAKGRPADHPLIVHIADMADLKRWAADVPRSAWLLAEKFWPGPLTLIVPRSQQVNPVVTGGQKTIGLRVPSHPVAQRLLKAFGGGIAAPSANRFGRISPTTAQHVRDDLGADVDLVIDGGPCDVGIESTIVDLSGAQPSVLRPGRISVRQLEDALLVQLNTPAGGAPRVPGTLPAHYAPRTALRLVAADALETFLRKDTGTTPCAVLAPRGRPRDTKAALWQVAPADAEAYAQQLYALLRRLDTAGCALIVVELPPVLPEWEAVRDRLVRAAAGSADGAEHAAVGT